jgi:DNA polymerase
MQKEKLIRQIAHLKMLKRLGYEYCDAVQIPKNDAPKVSSDTLLQLRTTVLSCHLCDLAKSRKHVVFGEGSETARLMIIGEAPGATEDEEGHPFVGRSGELLTKMIENAVGIPLSSVYIANIVKCRPPANRDPEAEEVEMCKPFLEKQIELIKPQVILALGGISFANLTGEATPIAKARGKVYDYHGIKLVPSFHPSYLLRNPSAKKEAFADMLIVKELLNKTQ